MFESLDLETYSAVDLKTAGLYNYAADKTTGIHCMSWGHDPFEIQTWSEGEPFPADLREHIESGGVITAWNAAFEVALWSHCAVPKYGWPAIRIEQVRCSMAAAYAMGLPGALENAAPALGVAQRKDAAGKRVMLQLSQPKKDGTMWRPEDDPAKFEQLRAYNAQDVRTELAVRERLMSLSDEEQKLWQLDWVVNNRGVMVDLPSIDKAIALVEQEQKRLNAEMLRVTGGVVGKCTEVQLLVKWIRTQGVEIKGLAKADVLDALAGDLPPQVEAALRLRKEAAKSSTAKLVAMKARASSDGRVRGCHQFHGAATGRWAHRGIQPGNFPRPRKGMKQRDIEDAIKHFGDKAYVDMMYGPTMDAIADCLRGLLISAPGHELVSVDFSNVEGRVLAWLAGEEWKLQAFRDYDAGIGPDLYLVSAGRIYNVPPSAFTEDDPERQEGKCSELALGFGGGVGAFQSMARVYGVKVSDERADQIKAAWREAHPKVVQYWYDCENAAMDAVLRGGIRKAGAPGREVAYRRAGSFLFCRLPSGRVITYPYPEVRTVTTPWGAQKDALTFMTVLDDTQRKKGKTLPDPNSNGSWQRVSTYGGDLAQSNTQGYAACLLRNAITNWEGAGFGVVTHIHDQPVAEVPVPAAAVFERMRQLAIQLPSHAAGLPMAANGWHGTRFRK